MPQIPATTIPVERPRSLPRADEALSRLRRVLVPVDGSEFSEYALGYALEIAHRADAEVDLAYVNVLPPSIVLGDVSLASEWEQSAMRHAESYLDGLVSRIASTDDVGLATLMARDTSAARALVRLARSRGAGLTVMTTHGRKGAARVWLGSVAEAFVRDSPTPVLLLRPDGASPVATRRQRLFRRVLVAMDGSHNADAALEEAALLASLDGGSIELLRVIDPLPLSAGAASADGAAQTALETERRQALGYLDRRVRLLRLRGIEATATVLVDPGSARAIVDHAERIQADLLAVGTRGRKGLGRVLLGSVAEAVLRDTGRPVLVVPSAGSYEVR